MGSSSGPTFGTSAAVNSGSTSSAGMNFDGVFVLAITLPAVNAKASMVERGCFILKRDDGGSFLRQGRDIASPSAKWAHDLAAASARQTWPASRGGFPRHDHASFLLI